MLLYVPTWRVKVQHPCKSAFLKDNLMCLCVIQVFASTPTTTSSQNALLASFDNMGGLHATRQSSVKSYGADRVQKKLSQQDTCTICHILLLQRESH